MFKSKSKKVPVKAKTSSSSSSSTEKSGDKKPKLEEFIKNRDYTGAITLLEFQRHTGEVTPLTLPWLGYAAFHLGDYKKALDVYSDLASKDKLSGGDPIYFLYASCCQFYLGDYTAAEEEAMKGVDSTGVCVDERLQNRLLFHISHKQNDETKLMGFHAKISETTEDQLSLASIHYLRNHFQEATDIYKRLLIEYRDYLALQVYVSMCISEGTMVTMANGSSLPIEQVEVGDLVLSNTPGGLAPRAVTAVIKSGQKECVELLFNDDRKLICTPDHRVLTADGKWVTAGDLVVGESEVSVGMEYPHGDRTTDCGAWSLPTKALPLSKVKLVGRCVVGIKATYDLTVPSEYGEEYHSFMAAGIVVHNCYYKLDYYDVSLEILAPYLVAHPDSAIAINLKACNHYKLYDGKAAEQELKGMIELLSSASSYNFENDLVKHNLVVFRNGENALQILPPLIHTVPEARLNFVIYHLRHNEIMEAYELIKELEPTTPQEYILKGVVNASVGQLNDSREHLKLAQQFFQLVGASASECDTIPGRQCMASCFFLLKQFEDVLIYLNSVKAYSFNDSIFNFNHGIALAACEQFREAEEALQLVTDEGYRSEYVYLSWLARCCIMNNKPRDAWELYLKMESNTDSFAMLVLIANDCYKVGSFYYSAKAFDVLERLDPSNEYWEGKRGACCGVFQQVIARKEKKEHLRDIIVMLRNNVNSPQSEFMCRVMQKWCGENGMPINDGNARM